MFSTVEDLLADDERLQRTINPSRFDSTYLRSFVIAFFLVVIGVGIVGVGFLEQMMRLAAPVGVLVAVAGLLIASMAEVRRRFVMYHITDRKVIEETGIIDKEVVTVAFDQIANTAIDEDLQERLFDVGDIYISTAGTDTTEMVLNGVKDPAGFKVDLEELYMGEGQRFSYSTG